MYEDYVKNISRASHIFCAYCTKTYSYHHKIMFEKCLLTSKPVFYIIFTTKDDHQNSSAYLTLYKTENQNKKF